jgi:selenocysteine lyase/cysteine desulfurase
MSDFVYLDNAATTFPKPPEVIQFMCDFYQTRGVNPGRTGFDLALEAEETLADARRSLTEFFGSRLLIQRDRCPESPDLERARTR